MNIRLVAAFVMLVFMPVVGYEYSKLEVSSGGMLFAFLGYVFLNAYLVATGYNIMNKGKPL